MDLDLTQDAFGRAGHSPARIALGAVAFAFGFGGLVLATQDAYSAAPAPALAAARLAGQFQLLGRVTVAREVPGEHVGEPLVRTWTFSAPCPVGACSTVALVRARSTGSDKLTLRQREPGHYVGSGQFYAPLRCGGRTYRRGALVPFTISVRVTAATGANTPLATGLSASYSNRSRINLTPCFAVLGYDAAIYQGRLVTPPSGGVGP